MAKVRAVRQSEGIAGLFGGGPEDEAQAKSGRAFQAGLAVKPKGDPINLTSKLFNLALIAENFSWG